MDRHSNDFVEMKKSENNDVQANRSIAYVLVKKNLFCNKNDILRRNIVKLNLKVSDIAHIPSQLGDM